MGLLLYLGLGKLEIDWGHSKVIQNHSKLFLQSDVKEILYYYRPDDDEIVAVEKKEGYSRKLKDIKLRLKLLGYTEKTSRDIYEEHINSLPKHYNKPPIDYDQFVHILQQVDVNKIELDAEGDPDYCDLGEFVSRYLFEQKEFRKSIPKTIIIDQELGTIYENIDPYLVLYILANNPANDEIEVQWRCDDFLEAECFTKEDIYEDLSISERYLIVTEGSSDSYIIKESLKILTPSVADFFYFVDMEENYPFTGTGNLHRFCQGLSSINILNKVIVIYDNDTAGNEKYNESSNLNLPPNMKIMKLPSHREFEEFKTIGPNGESFENIDGKAVSIELFLDLKYKNKSEPLIRWKSFNEKTDSYQGTLIDKETYIRNFKTAGLGNIEYNYDKLTYLLNCIFETCTN